MATNRILQLLRSKTLYESLDAAKIAIGQINTASDGEVRLARYQTSEGVKSLLCVYHTNENFDPALEGTITNMPGWTFIEDASESTSDISALQTEVNNIETGVGLGNNGAYTVPSGTNYLNSTTSVMNALGALDTAVDGIQDAINAMDENENYSTTGDAVVSDGKVITAVKQVDGQVSALSADFSDVKIAGYTKNANATGALAATDSLENALSKLENTIAANNTANTVSSSDQSITVTKASTGTDVIVNVDNATIVKDSTSHAIKTNLKIAEVVPTGSTLGTDQIKGTLGTNVQKAYALVDGNGATYGKQIDIYKDSALQSVKLLHADLDADPQLKPTYSNGTWTDIASASQTEENLALCYAYLDVNGDTIVEAVPVGDFLRESEFGDGLQVNSGIVSVKKDTTSGKVRIADGDAGLVDVLTVSSNGVKVDNIQGAINYAVQNASTSLAVTAEGDDYVSASVDANTDNKHVVVETNVQNLTATAGTAGVYDSTTGAQTTAPTHGTLTGVADSLADSSDIATKVKTYVDGEIAIEAARADAQVQAEENRATTAENNIDTAVGITNHAYTAPSGTNYLGSTTSVMNALSALDTAAGNGLDQVNGSDAIDVTTKANKAQTISLILDEATQGNGNENTGTDNALTITDNGLFLSTTWDCGVY